VIEAEDSVVHDAFVLRLRVIEEQPLVDRATAYDQLHNELNEILESGDSTYSDG
jgi:hypothetical protein